MSCDTYAQQRPHGLKPIFLLVIIPIIIMQAKVQVAYIEKGQTHTHRDRQCNREQSCYNM